MAGKKKAGSVIQFVLLGFLLMGLGGFGVRNFSGSRDPVLARVGDAEVTAKDYGRALQSELAAIQQQTGKPVPRETIEGMGLPQGVQARLISAAALEAEAKSLGLSVGDAAVAKALTEAPAFKGPGGQFDRLAYQTTLKREGISEAEFESDLRTDEARVLIQKAVMGGVAAPAAQVAGTVAWLTETRDLRWQELTEADLPEPVAEPDDATLTAWHEANAARFTAPETRSLTYAWLTPELLAPKVTLDEASLRALYEQRKAEFQKPARRMVERLVYPTAEEAAAAKARLDAGSATFEQLAAERGLALADIDLGEVTEAALGPAGPAVFAAANTGVVGPVDTEVGPALIAVNAILDPVDIPFEAAQEDLRAEAALDRARREIDEKSAALADILAGGASLEDLAKEGGLEIGKIDWTGEGATDAGSIAGYPAFREAAAAVKEGEFPQLHTLDDGGVFAVRLDKLTPPTLIPFDKARAAVLADWRAAEVERRLASLGEERRLAGPVAGGTPVSGVTRDTVVDGLPPEAVTAAFRLAPAESAVIEAEGRVWLVTLDAIKPAPTNAPEAEQLATAVRRSISEGIAQDIFADYSDALQARHGLSLDPKVAAAVLAQFK